MKKAIYTAKGYSFGSNNEHLMGVVGDSHNLDDWMKIVFRNDYAKAVDYFANDSEKDIVEYILNWYKLRLEKR